MGRGGGERERERGVVLGSFHQHDYGRDRRTVSVRTKVCEMLGVPQCLTVSPDLSRYFVCPTLLPYSSTMSSVVLQIQHLIVCNASKYD